MRALHVSRSAFRSFHFADTRPPLHSKFEWQTIITRSLPFNCQITDLPPHSPQKANRIRIACPRKLTWKREAFWQKKKNIKQKTGRREKNVEKKNKIGRKTNWKSNICHILQLENQRQHARLRLPATSYQLELNPFRKPGHTHTSSFLPQSGRK